MNMSFILVDDDEINNFINERKIRSEHPEAALSIFTNPAKGLEHILNNFTKESSDKTIIFLDLNMPEMSGWEFANQIAKAELSENENLLIYITSSSLNASDIDRARNSDHIVDFIEKPLSKEFLETLKA
ncbi:response regulator [Bacteroidota bacterium]